MKRAGKVASKVAQSIKPTVKAEQLDITMDKSFYHMMRALWHNGQALQLTPAGYFIYGCIRANTDFNSGESRVSMETLEAATGLSRQYISKVIRDKLVPQKLIRIEKDGNRQFYICTDVISVKNHGSKIADLSYDYVPALFGKDQKALTQMIEGQLPLESNGRFTIQNLTINVQYNPAAATATQNVNVGDPAGVTLSPEEFRLAVQQYIEKKNEG